jgi:hypothetical protein
MAVNYDEKILSTFGKRSKRVDEPDSPTRGVFVVDPNKVVTEDDSIKPRYVKQEDLVMYANITARLNPDNAIIDDGTDNNKVITIGRVGINFLNPLAKAPKDKLGNIMFGDKKNKDYFTTEWSDYFTSNAEQGSFFDPETFGVSNIDVTHNASLTPIIKIEFIDVQGRTLLERGDDPSNPYNIFYRFPYPLFTLTIKGYFGKAIEYPLSMTKTSTTFDASTGNYIIRAEFLSRTFSIYNNFLMVYAYAAPYMYERGEKGSGSFLGKRILTALYQKQNQKYAELYGVGSTEYLKHEFVKFPTILDLTRAQSVLGYETLGVEEQLKQIGTEREKSLERNGELQTAHTNGESQNGSYWDTVLLKSNRDNTKFFLRQETIDRLKNDEITLSFTDFPEPSYILSDYLSVLTFMDEGDNTISTELKIAIYNAVVNETGLPDKYRSAIVKENLKSLIREELILMYNTSSNDDEELAKIYYTKTYFNLLHKTITKTISQFYDKEENRVIDELGFKLKGSLGYVPNMSNVLRILMNNMQIFLTMLNLVGLNAARQIADNQDRMDNQMNFGEYEVDVNSPDKKRFYPFPNYFKKKFDTNTDDFVWEKTFPSGGNTLSWFEVQFVQELNNAVKRLHEIKTIDSQTETDVLFQTEQINKIKTEVLGEKRMALLTTLLTVNNLDYYNDQQSERETVFEFINKVLLFSTLGFLNAPGDVTKINNLTKLFTDHEFDLIVRRYQNKDPNDLHDFYNKMSVFFDWGVGEGQDFATNYDRLCYELVNGVAIDPADNRSFFGVTTNDQAIVNNINNLLPEFKALLAKNYTVDELRSFYGKIDAIIDKATSVSDFKKLYQFNPLRYKNSRNPNNDQTVKALFFNGLDAHDQYDGSSAQLNEYGSKLQDYRKTSLVSANSGYFYTLNNEKGDTLNFMVDGKVEANDPNSTALTFALKSDNLLKDTNYVGGLNLDSSKKITSGIKYSKVRI